ncbi:hypothetical protein BDA96_01G324600 [Sorghum bicolor]|uniref:Uncharacterized protein n=2 Tax=Sorghum bicolor TaxID=4558 RepID=A0A921V0L4_SORBI|nr:hypothetical protein SORBI_3001G300301 [Sorghum bicolor]KAG0550270.1 hypothetical protein BDA96_01G324600 [Sorghum bicolor]
MAITVKKHDRTCWFVLSQDIFEKFYKKGHIFRMLATCNNQFLSGSFFVKKKNHLSESDSICSCTMRKCRRNTLLVLGYVVE